MKISLGAIKAVEPVLAKIANADLPFSMSFKVSKMLRTLSVDISSFDDLRNKLILKFGKEEADKPGVYSVLPDNMALYNVELNQLALTEIEVDIPFTMGDLEAANLVLSPKDILILQDTILAETVPPEAVLN